MRDTKQEILHFWFEETEPQLWFQPHEAFDERVRDRFSVIYDMAKEGLCDKWAVDAEGALALCLVLDQFPRHIYRGLAAAYATDEKALFIAQQSVARGFDQMFSHEKRFFFYLPFEHSERMENQRKSVKLFEAMKEENPLAYRVSLQHIEIIEKFGRYPFRNKALGRVSTPEEEEWLKNYTGFGSVR